MTKKEKEKAIAALKMSAPIMAMPEENFSEYIQILNKIMDLLEKTPIWTPVSEGMPKKTDYYLIQYSRKICPDEMAVAFYDVEEKESDPNYSWEFKPNCGEYKEVIAWMPLLGKYKPKSEVQNE